LSAGFGVSVSFGGDKVRGNFVPGLFDKLIGRKRNVGGGVLADSLAEGAILQ